jgi:16S rRNA (cytosine1402-N4)-methyltransferase
MLPNVLQRSASDHVPVLAEEVRSSSRCSRRDGRRRDLRRRRATSRLLASDLHGEGKLIAIDRDPSARHVLRPLQGGGGGVQARFLRGEFSTRPQPAGRQRRAGGRNPARPRCLLDAARPAGARFSYAADAPLDMRMDTAAELSARELVNEADERELALIFKRFGESATRGRSPARSSPAGRAAVRAHDRPGDTIKQAIPTPARFGDGHPGQAGLPGAADRRQRRARRARGGAAGGVRMLRPGGRSP